MTRVPDGGLTLDANGDGVPDFPDMNGDGVIDAGMSANLDISGDGSSHRRIGYKIVGTDIEKDAGGTDNCPSIPNADAGQLRPGLGHYIGQR